MAFGDFTVVRSTVKRVLNSSGTLAEVAVNTPAFEFNADGTYKGLLVEPAATNLATYSEEFDNAAWTKTDCTITANATTAPDGTTTADKIVAGVGVTGNIVQFVTVADSTVYAVSIYAKASEYSLLSLGFVVKSGAEIGATFNLSTNAITNYASAPITTSIEDAPNGFKRCVITVNTATGATSPRIRIYVPTNATTGDGTSGYFIWGAQLETGSVATSYIPTTASTANRTADDISLSSASSLIGQGEGTLYCEVEWRSDAGVGKPGQYLCEIGDGTANNRIVLYQNNGADEIQMFLNSNGVVVVNQGASSTAYSGTVKLALAYKQDDTVLAKGGSIVSTDTSVDLSALGTLTHVFLGQSYINGEQANMWIRSLALFPTRLSNAQLQALTT